MEILNQYLNNWKGFNTAYNLNTLYYYIYQSFLLKPPVKKTEDIRIVSQPDGIDHKSPPLPPPRKGPVPAGFDDEDEHQMKVFRVKTKIENFLDSVNHL